MSKVESARKAELSAPAPEKSAEWTAELSQRSRGSETKVALLLVVVLLGALSFVVYKKLSLKPEDVAQSGDFQPVADSGDGRNVAAAGGAGDEASRETAPQTAVEDPQADPWSSPEGSPTNPMLAQSEPATVEWGSPDDAASTAAAVSQLEMPPSESEEEMPGGTSAAWEPFDAPQEPSDAAPSASAAVADNSSTPDAFDPFEGAGGPTEPAETVAWSSDAPGAADPFAGEDPAAADPPNDAANLAAPADGPVMELFPEDGAVEPIRTASDSPHSGASTRDPDEPVEDGGAALTGNGEPEGGEPLLMAPSAARAAPVNAGNPFETPAEAASAANPLPSPPLESNQAPVTAELDFNSETPTETFEPLPESSVPAAEAWPGGTNAVDRGSSSESDPFSPSSGVTLASSEEEVAIHVVESGDSFWTIAREHYGAGRYFNALAAYNQVRIPNPQSIRPGMKVMVPDVAVLEQRYPQLTGGTYSPGQTDRPQPSGFFVERGTPMYRVGKGDTLSGIAHRHLGRASRWIQIYGMNQGQLTNGGSLKVGMVLRLPADASQVSAVSGERGQE